MSHFIVKTTTTFQPEMREKCLEMARLAYPIFQKQPGLIDLHMHLSHDETHTFTYFVWKDRAAHEACLVSPDFAPIADLWKEIEGSPLTQFDLQTYDELVEGQLITPDHQK